MLMRTDPFRDLDRLTQQVFGTAARPAADADGRLARERPFVVEFDLPGIDANSIDLDVERNVLTVRADRPAREGIEELVAAERPRGVFSRQLILGDNLDTDQHRRELPRRRPAARDPRGREGQAPQDLRQVRRRPQGHQRLTATPRGTSMTSTIAEPPAADQIDSFLTQLEDAFDDTVWVDAEFYAIIAANFDTEPPEPPQPPTGLPARWHQPGGTRWRRSRQRLASQVVAGHHHRRQRSPPNST